jgi:hypothetical protein
LSLFSWFLCPLWLNFLPPEAGIAELLPEPAVLHIVEVPPLHVPIDEKDISPGGFRA